MAASVSPGGPTALSAAYADLSWSEPIQVTYDAGDDRRPLIGATPNSTATVVWRSPRSGEDAYWFARVAANGSLDQEETYLSNRVVSVPYSDAVFGPQVAFDSRGAIHLVYDNGTTVRYTKVAPDGSTLVTEKTVGPLDSAVSNRPSIAVGIDDTVHIAHQEYRFQCEDVAYDKLDNFGGDIWIDRVVTSDLATITFLNRVRVDPFNGSAFFTLASNEGMWLARFNKYGVKDMSSVRLTHVVQPVAPDVSATPDGTMHTARVNGTQILYDSVHGNGTIAANDRTVPLGNGSAPKDVRVLGLQDGRALLAWDAAQGASRQVYLAFVTPNASGGWDLGAPVRLTNSTGWAVEPWLATDANERLYVAWSDNSSGNFEVYFSKSVACGGIFVPDAEDLSASMFIPAGETRSIEAALHNAGDEPMYATLHLNRSQAFVDDGWDVSIDRAFVAGLAPGASQNVTLTVIAPALLPTAAFVSYDVDVRIGCLFAPALRVTFVHSLVFERSLGLTVLPYGAFLQPGGEDTFAVTVSNGGDVGEDGVLVSAAAGLLPRGITVSPESAVVSMAPGEAVVVNMTVRAAPDAPGATQGDLAVVARTSDGQVASPTITVGVFVDTVFDLRATARDPALSAQPGEGVELRFLVEALGNAAYPVEVRLSLAASDASSGGSQPLNPSEVYLKGGESHEVVISHEVPPGALAGAQLQICAIAEAFTYGKGATACSTIEVEERRAVALEGAAQELALREGDVARPSVGIANQGNAVEEATLTLGGLPAEWGYFFVGVGSVRTNITLSPGETRAVVITLAVPPGALAGEYHLRLSAAFASGAFLEADIKIAVQPRYGLSATTGAAERAAPPGGVASYYFEVANIGNAPDAVWFSISDLPPEVEVRLYLVAEELTPLGDGRAAQVPLDLAPAGSALVLMEVALPTTGLAARTEFAVLASGHGGAGTTLAFTLVREAPDLRVHALGTSASALSAGVAAAVEFEVENAGPVRSAPAHVVVFVDGVRLWGQELPTLDSGDGLRFSVSWTPAAGNHTLRVWVGTAASPEEQALDPASDGDWTNNEAYLEVAVAGREAEAASTPAVGAVGAVGALLVWGTTSRGVRRPRNRPRRKE